MAAHKHMGCKDIVRTQIMQGGTVRVGCDRCPGSKLARRCPVRSAETRTTESWSIIRGKKVGPHFATRTDVGVGERAVNGGLVGGGGESDPRLSLRHPRKMDPHQPMVGRRDKPALG